MVMDNTFGQMEALTRVILSMEFGMGTGYGQIKSKLKYFLAAIEWIKKKALASMNGLENKYIKGSSDKILDKGLVVFTK